MAGIFGGGGGAIKTPIYTCLQVQTSVEGLPLAILWGANKLSPNVIDVFSFYSQPADKGKGGKGSGEDYFAAVILALCAGATAGNGTEQNVAVGRAFANGQAINFATLGFGVFPGTNSQAPWSSAVAVGHNLAYARVAYLANGNLALGTSATIPNYNLEVFSSLRSFNVGLDSMGDRLPDANFGDVIPDFLTNTVYGLNMDPLLLAGFDDLVQYQLAAGIFVSPLLKDQEQVSSILGRWGALGNFWTCWNGTQLKAISLADTVITGNGVTYTPNTTPVYDLGPDDFQTAEKNSNQNDPPVKVKMRDPADAYNVVQLNCSLRDHNYENTPYRWTDALSIDSSGTRAPNIITATEICINGTANVCKALIGQRGLWIDRDYEFKLLPNFILLEGGDLVTLTEPNIGLVKQAVRIKTVDEDDKGMLDFVAEIFLQGVGTPSQQEQEPWGGGEPWNVNVDPGSVNTPAFIQPDPSLTQNQSQIWAALSGGQFWGGCAVFVSFDNMNYGEVGRTDNHSLQGTLTAELPLAAGLDTVNTLAVDCTESLGVIPTGTTDADAQAFRTLCLVDDELLAYGSVTPTGSYSADLTYLERGLYGTAPADHTAGAPWSRIDSTKVFAYALPKQYLGATIYFKFPSANIFGNEPQTLAECEAYTFVADQAPVPQSVAVNYQFFEEGGGSHPLPALVNAIVSCTENPNFDTGTFGARWSAHPAGTSGQVYGTATVSNPGTISSATLAASGDGYAYLEMQAQTPAGAPLSNWSDDVGANTVPPPTAPAGVNQFDNFGNWLGVLVTWTPPGSGSPSSYNIFVGTPLPGALVGVAAGTASQQLIPANAITAFGAAGPPAGLDMCVQAVYGSNGSIPTDVVLVTASAPLANLITSPSGTAETTAALLAWTPPAGITQPTFYRIEYWHDAITIYQSEDIAAPASNYMLRGLTTGTAYTIAVVSYNAAGTAEVYSGSPLRPTLTPTVTVTPT